MDVAIRRTGVPLYTILQVHFPASLSFPKATSRRNCQSKRSVPDLRPTSRIPRKAMRHPRRTGRLSRLRRS